MTMDAAVPEFFGNSAQQRGNGDKPRIGVVLTNLGTPSEIWAMRQLRAFRRVEPVLFGWTAHEGGSWRPDEFETHLFDVPFARPPSLALRVGRRLGLPGLVLPPRDWAQRVGATLRAAQLDGVFCHFAWTANYVVHALDGAGAPPVAAQVHGRDVSHALANPAYRAALRRTLPRLAFTAAVASYQVERLRPLGLGPHALIPCGAPVADFASRPLPERADGERMRFVSVCRINYEKGVMETLAAFEKVAAEIDAEWICIGDGPLAGDLAARAAAGPAAGRVHLPGWLPTEAVAAELSRAHAFVQHSRPHLGWHEGFSVAMTEAGAAGLPLIASRLGGNPDLVANGANGLLFDVDDVAGQTAAMLALSCDEVLRRRMGAQARAVSLRLDSGQMAAQLEDAMLDAFARQPAVQTNPRASLMARFGTRAT